MFIRKFQSTDFPHILSLFYDTVHTVNARDYTPEQLDVWAPTQVDEQRWRGLLDNNIVYVAESQGIIVGFGDLTNEGYVTRLFVHKDFQSQGVGAALLQQLEDEAHRLGIHELVTEASITAKPFFEKHGFVVVKLQTVGRRGVKLQNYVMKKVLDEYK